MCSTGSETLIAAFEVEAIMGPLEVKRMWGALSVHLRTVARTANRFTEWKQNFDLSAVRRAPISAAAPLKGGGNKTAETCETGSNWRSVGLTVQRSMICVSLMASVDKMWGPTTGRSVMRGLAWGTWYSLEGMLCGLSPYVFMATTRNL